MKCDICQAKVSSCGAWKIGGPGYEQDVCEDCYAEIVYGEPCPAADRLMFGVIALTVLGGIVALLL